MDVGTVVATLELRDRFSSKIQVALRGVDTMAKRASAMGDALQKASLKMTASLTLGLGGSVVGAVRSFTSFETAMKKAQAAMADGSATAQKVASDMAILRAAAIEWGQKTSFSAAEAGEALAELGKAGFSAQQAAGALPSVLQLAEASSIGLADAASITANTMATFGHSIDDLARDNDILTKAVNASTVDLADLRETLKYVGPIARTTGTSLAEVASAAALLSGAGIKGSMAGTALRETLEKMVNPGTKTRELMAQLGITSFVTHGKVMTLVEAVRLMEQRMPRLGGSADQAGALMEAFGDRAGPAMAALIARGSDELQKMNEDLEASAGTAQRASEIMNSGLGGAIERMWGAIETMAASIGEALVPAIRTGASWLEEFSGWITDHVTPAFRALPESIQGTAFALTALLVAAGPVAGVLGTLLKMLTPLSAGVYALTGAITWLNTSILMVDGSLMVAVGTLNLIIPGWTIWAGAILGVAAAIVTWLGGWAPMWDAIKSGASWLHDRLVPAWDALKTAVVQVSEVLGALVGIAVKVQTAFYAWLWEGIKPIATLLGGEMLAVMTKVLGLAVQLQAAFVGWLGGTVLAALKEHVETLRTMWAFVRDITRWANGGGKVGALPVPGAPTNDYASRLYHTTETTESLIEASRRLATQLGGSGRGSVAQASKEAADALAKAAIAAMEVRTAAMDGLLGASAEDVGTLMHAIDALERIGGVSKLTKEQTEQLHEQVGKVLDYFKSLGHTGPPAWAKLYEATRPAITVTKSLTAEMQKQIAALGKVVPQVSLFHAAWAKLTSAQQIDAAHFYVRWAEKFLRLVEAINPALGEFLRQITGISQVAPKLTVIDKITTSVRETISDIPDLFVQAFTNGGGVAGAFKALGVKLADAVMRPLMERIKEAGVRVSGAIGAGVAGASAVGGAWGGSTGAMIGTTASTIGGAVLATTALGVAAKTSMVAMIGLGAATLGIGVAAVGVYLLAKKFFTVSKEVKKAREDIKAFQQELWKTATPMQIAEAAGRDWAATTIVVRDAYARMGLSAQAAERDVREMWDDKHPEAARAAIARINDVVGAFRNILAKANEQLGGLLEQSVELGVRLPQALLDSLTRLRDIGDLTEDNIKLLERLMGAPEVDYKKFEEAAARYSINPDALGLGYQQSRTTGTAQQMVDDMDLLLRGGASMGTILHGMREEISAVVLDSLKFGTTIPENMQPWIAELDRTNQLLDENGEKIVGVEKLKFGESLQTSVQKLVEEIQKLVNMLSGPLQRAIDAVPKQLRVGVGLDIEGEFHRKFGDAPDDDGGYAVGTLGRHGRWFNRFRPSGEWVKVHNEEAIVTRAQAPAFAADFAGQFAPAAAVSEGGRGGDTMPVHIQIGNDVFWDTALRRVGERWMAVVHP